MCSLQFRLSACSNLTTRDKKCIVSFPRSCQYPKFGTITSWHDDTHACLPQHRVYISKTFIGENKNCNKKKKNTQKYISRQESTNLPDGWHAARSVLRTRKIVESPHCYLELSARCMCTDTHFRMYKKICNNYAENIWRHRTKFGRAFDLASVICAPLFYFQ